jgi:nucleotide-binding universal stress UspA family protein
VAPQSSTLKLLEGGPAAVAIAPANYRADREPRITRIGLLADAADAAAIETAHSLADQLDATVTHDAHQVDLLVVASRAEAPIGRVMISSRSQNAIENAASPVLVVARGVPLHFSPQLAIY